LTDLKFAQLDRLLLSLPECEAIWSAPVRSGRVLFQSFPARARLVPPRLTYADQRTLEMLADDMLREIAIKGPVPRVAGGGERRRQLRFSQRLRGVRVSLARVGYRNR
jgi:hypothetical protein